MLYVDTSVLVAMLTDEPKASAILKWYANSDEEMVSATWCVTEFASALGLKQRTSQITQAEAKEAWSKFERMCENDLDLLPVDAGAFYDAAQLTMDASAGLRSGDALHLACALRAKVKNLATLDVVLAKNAKRLKLPVVSI